MCASSICVSVWLSSIENVVASDWSIFESTGQMLMLSLFRSVIVRLVDAAAYADMAQYQRHSHGERCEGGCHIVDDGGGRIHARVVRWSFIQIVCSQRTEL